MSTGQARCELYLYRAAGSQLPLKSPCDCQLKSNRGMRVTLALARHGACFTYIEPTPPEVKL